MKLRTVLLLALFAAAAAGLGAWALQPRPVTVETALVAEGVFEQAIVDDGKTRVRERYVVAAPLAGRVGRITLHEGDTVREGQSLAVLTPAAPAFHDARTDRELQARIGAAQSALSRARAETLRVQAQRDQAAADLERQAKLARDGFVSQGSLEQFRLALRTSERAVEAARFGEQGAGHDLEQARAAFAQYRGGTPGAAWHVRSPVTGAVLKVLQQSEAPVALGAPLLEVGDPRSLEAVVDVLSQEAVGVRAGMAARLSLGAGVAPLAARVRRVEPAAFTKVSALGIEEQRVNVVLDFAEPLDRVQTVGDGFRVEAHIVTHREERALKVPVGALFRDGAGWAVFVVAGARAEKRPLEASRRNGAEARVEKGLSAGERVVVYPSDALHDGARVALRP
jgi:HlyD family secretion protein